MSKKLVNSSSSFHRLIKNETNNKSMLCEDVGKRVDIYNHLHMKCVSEIIRDKFYFATLNAEVAEPKPTSNIYFFSIDNELVYYNFYNDFGPLNLACLYKYCQGVNRILKDPTHRHQKIIHFTCNDAEKRANAAYLTASYCVLYLNKTPHEAYRCIVNNKKILLKPFQDASLNSSYTIRLIDCLKALHKASLLGFFNFDDFNVREFERYAQMKNGDLNWIIPGKFLAFLGPNTEQGSMVHYPEKYLNYFMKNEVRAVIRLNQKNYESFRFTNAGILHYDLFFPDGSVPPKKILNQFLEIAETTQGAMAVHCKAGLGRTGTLIAAYVMKHYRLTAKEAIAWLRICRPGSVIGHQQTWLEQLESNLWREGCHYRLKYHGNENLILHHKRGIYSLATKLDLQTRCKDNNNKANLKQSTSEKLNTSIEKLFSNPKTLAFSAQIGTKNLSQTEKYRFNRCNRTTTQGEILNQIKVPRDNLIFVDSINSSEPSKN